MKRRHGHRARLRALEQIVAGPREQRRLVELTLEQRVALRNCRRVTRQTHSEVKRVGELVTAFGEVLATLDPVVERRIAELDREAADQPTGVATLHRITHAFDRAVYLANAAGERRIEVLANEPAVMPLGEIADALVARIDGETRRALRDSTDSLRRASERARHVTIASDEATRLLEQLVELRALAEAELAEAHRARDRAEHSLALWIEHTKTARDSGDAVLIDSALERVDECIARVSEAEVEVSEYQSSVDELITLHGNLQANLHVRDPSLN